MYVHIYAKLQNVIQLSLTLTKLCHERNHLLNFYILLENAKNCYVSTKFGTPMHNVSIKCIIC